jgi:molecular chaperone DnaK (HSP70)
VKQSLQKAKLDKSQIDGIIITSNALHVAKVQPFLEAYFEDKKFYEGIRPDEAVVRGAAIEAQVLLGDDGTDVCPPFPDLARLLLGISTSNGIFAKLIPRNPHIPTRKSQILSTATDDQSKVVLQMLEGERLIASKNNCQLGAVEKSVSLKKDGRSKLPYTTYKAIGSN